MNVINKFLDVMRLNPDEDDYDFDNDDFELDDELEENESIFKKIKLSWKDKDDEIDNISEKSNVQVKSIVKNTPKNDITKKDIPKSESLNKEPIKQVEQQVKSIRPERPKITPISKSRKQANGMEVCVIKPTSIEDEIEITDTLLNGRTVIINMEGIDIELAQRIIDFTSGSTYAIHGNLQKISTYIFIATPSGIDISGDIQNIMETFSLTGLTV